MQLLLFLTVYSTLFGIYSSQDAHYFVMINDKAPLHITDERFLSVALDCGLVFRNWKTFNASSPTIQTLAQGLQNSVLRLGGTACDYMFFNSTRLETKERFLKRTQLNDLQFNLRGKDWDKLIVLSQKANWTLLFDANVMIRTQKDTWDPSNFHHFMDYNEAKNFSNLWFELGNEPNNFPSHFNRTITAEQLAEDFKTMRNVVKLRSFFEKSKIVGADIGNPYLRREELGLDPAKYIHDFFVNGHKYIDAFTWHQYYLKGSIATVQDFINPQVMDKFVAQVGIVRGIMQSILGDNSSFPVMMGETSSAYGSGAPNISNTYVAGFLWMDKLGVAAKNGYEIVIRQTFYDGNYALISPSIQPYPDYYLSYLYKKLVGPQVLEVKVLNPDPNLRIYAHCARHMMGFSLGPVVLYGMNLSPNSTAHIKTQYLNKKAFTYVLTPQNSDLQSQHVLLNGKLLLFQGNKLPELIPQPIDVSDMRLPPLSFGFFVVNQALAEACP